MGFGIVWLADALLRLLQGGPPQLAYWMVVMAGQEQPSFLSGWFAFWSTVVASDPAIWWYGIAAVELLIALMLLAGFLRRVAYLVGLVLSLFLWTVPGGLGGPYAPGSTDMGAGIVYAVAFVALLQLDSVSGVPRLALDAPIVRWWTEWRSSATTGESRPSIPARRESALIHGRSAARTSLTERDRASYTRTRVSPDRRN